MMKTIPDIIKAGDPSIFHGQKDRNIFCMKTIAWNGDLHRNHVWKTTFLIVSISSIPLKKNPLQKEKKREICIKLNTHTLPKEVNFS